MKYLFFHAFLLIIILLCVIITLVSNMKKNISKVEAKSTKKTDLLVKKNKSSVQNIKNVTKENKQCPWWILGLVCPVIGIVLYFVWKNNKKNNAKNILTGTIIGAGLWIFIGLSIMISKNMPVKVVDPVNEESTKFVSANWYNDTLENKVVTVIGSSTCPHCQEYKPIIEDLAEEYDFKLYFVEADQISEEDSSVLHESYDLENYEGYVPYTFVIDKGKFVTDTTGFESEETTIKFLKENKVIKN